MAICPDCNLDHEAVVNSEAAKASVEYLLETARLVKVLMANNFPPDTKTTVALTEVLAMMVKEFDFPEQVKFLEYFADKIGISMATVAVPSAEPAKGVH